MGDQEVLGINAVTSSGANLKIEAPPGNSSAPDASESHRKPSK